MNITIVGAGNSGSGLAADLTLKGHEVTLVKSSSSHLHDRSFNTLVQNGQRMFIREDGQEKMVVLRKVTRSFDAISDADIVIVAVQSTYHDSLLERMKPYIRPGQIVLLNPGYFSTAFTLKHGYPEDVAIVEAQSSFLDCRVNDEAVVSVGFRNVRNPVAIYPYARRAQVIPKLRALDQNLVFLDSIAEAALHNPNLIVHTVGGVMSIPRIETMREQYCMYHEVFTPAVWRIVEALDCEKMDVLERLGCERVPYVEACKYRNSLDDTRDAKDVFFWYAAMPTRAMGPADIESRYITEDIPQGLVMLESLAQAKSVPVPVCMSLIELAGAALGRDLRAGGRTVEALGMDNIRTILDDRAPVQRS